MNIEYIKCGDYYIPNLRLPPQPEEPLTKYGRMRLNFLKEYRADATSLYGIYTGGVETVVGLPVSVCYGLAVATLPAVASLSTVDFDKAHEKAGFSLIGTLFLSGLASVFVFLPLKR